MAERTSGSCRLRVLLALALAVLAPAGCGAIPDSGVAGPGRELVEAAPEPLRVAALGPRPGAGPDEIVQGFLRAGGSSDDDQMVARSFLVGSAVRSWQPSRGVVVYPDDVSLTTTVRGTTSPVRVDVTTPVLATIDEQGRFVQARQGTTAHAVFTAVRTDGRWRVSVVDGAFGSWLPQFALDRTYSPLPVSFVADGTTTLVPDLRWLPGPRPSLATALVRQLLLGPPAYLGAAVVTGFPRGTTLAVDAVPTTGGVAQVDLSAQALTATPAMRQMLWAQLTATLRRLPSVAEVQLTVGGAPFRVPGVTSASVYGDTGFRDDVRVTGEPVVLSGDRLVGIDAVSGKLNASRATDLSPGVRLRSLAVGAGGSLVVGVETSGRRLVRTQTGGRPTVLLTGSDLVDPVIDVTGAVWSADVAQPGRLRVVVGTAVRDVAPRASTLTPDWLAGRAVQAVDVSRDGARVLVVSRGPGGDRRVDVAGVRRGTGGQPLALAASLEVARSLRRVIDAAWADRTDLVVLARGAGDVATRPYDVVVGGPATALAAAPDAVAVAAGDGLRAVYLTTDRGTVLARSGTGWATVGVGRSVSVPE